MRLEWTCDLETGVEMIDDDHKMIVELYNKILHYYDSETDIIMLERAISDFKFLFTLHFLKEENLMVEIAYPEFDRHAKEHEVMIKQLNNFPQSKGEEGESTQKIAFLVLQWLSSHLEGADRRLAEFAKHPHSMTCSMKASSPTGSVAVNPN